MRDNRDLEHHIINNDGVELALSVTGSGPDLLFVHGLGSAQVLWRPFISALSDRYRCWNLDLRGHGASARAPGAYTFALYTTDVVAALDHIGRPTIGIGHSLGGGSLARVGGAGHPNLAALYVVDFDPLPPKDTEPGIAQIVARQLEMLRSFQPENRPLADYEAVISGAPYVAGGTNADHMLPEQLRGRAESLSQLDPESFEVLISGQMRSEPVPPTFAVPAKFIGADPALGAVLRRESHDQLRHLTPHVEIRELEGVGHQMMMIRHYDEVIREDLQTWLKKVTE